MAMSRFNLNDRDVMNQIIINNLNCTHKYIDMGTNYLITDLTNCLQTLRLILI